MGESASGDTYLTGLAAPFVPMFIRDTLADVKRCDGRFGGFPFEASGSLPRRGQLLDARFRRTRATFTEELTR